MVEDWRLGGFGLYIHWPFCESKCPYCDFNSHVSSTIDHDEWRKAYLQALESYARETPDRVLNSVYFGGGTPSLMDPRTVSEILQKASQLWRLANDVEITLEANPSSVEAEKFADFRSVGVNRVSLGVQALNDDDLKRLGRLHDQNAALRALDVANSTFDRVNFDLIYARQDQSLSSWEQELQTALSFGPSHLSLYQLTVEAGTAFGDRFQRGGLRGLPDEDLAADMFLLTQDICEARGLPAYEVSNHAESGQESRHNLIYWQGGDYVGIGPGAHGRISLTGTRYATWTELSPKVWLTSVQNNGSGEAGRAALSPRDHASEYLMMSLRTADGTDLTRWNAIAGTTLKAEEVESLIGLGLLELETDTLRATRQGRMVLNAMLTALLPE